MAETKRSVYAVYRTGPTDIIGIYLVPKKLIGINLDTGVKGCSLRPQNVLTIISPSDN